MICSLLNFKVRNSNDFGHNLITGTGISDMYDTHTIRVPTPITVGTSDYNAFVVFEKLNMGGRGDPVEYGKQLAAMHRCTSPNGKFGYKINNTIGATPQINTYTDSWADFWDEYRLGYMLKLCKRDGAEFAYEKEVCEKVYRILSMHECIPSLVHGDLWSGNQAYTDDGRAVIFDPATYYGDREVDLAMTKLFGSNSKAFYESYNKAFPLPEGWEIRETIYNSYHILNHYVLFGGGYLSQAQRMLERILAYELK